MKLAQAVEQLYNLKVGVTSVDEGAPNERPHKPLLLLAVFDLIDEGFATPNKISWSQELRDRIVTLPFPSPRAPEPSRQGILHLKNQCSTCRTHH